MTFIRKGWWEIKVLVRWVYKFWKVLVNQVNLWISGYHGPSYYIKLELSVKDTPLSLDTHIFWFKAEEITNRYVKCRPNCIKYSQMNALLVANSIT